MKERNLFYLFDNHTQLILFFFINQVILKRWNGKYGTSQYQRYTRNIFVLFIAYRIILQTSNFCEKHGHILFIAYFEVSKIMFCLKRFPKNISILAAKYLCRWLNHFLCLLNVKRNKRLQGGSQPFTFGWVR